MKVLLPEQILELRTDEEWLRFYENNKIYFTRHDFNCFKKRVLQLFGCNHCPHLFRCINAREFLRQEKEAITSDEEYKQYLSEVEEMKVSECGVSKYEYV